MRIRRIITGMFILLYVASMSYVSISGPYAEPDEQQDPPPKPALTLDDLIPEGSRRDNRTSLSVLFDEEIREMTMERYLIGVVAAEMPASFEREALKAQAVAARTNALHSIHINQKIRHPEANVCTDHTCCTAYYDDERLQEAWGNNYDVFILKIISAVIDTDGLHISYNNQPIQAVFHSSSNGMTESGGNVWSDNPPYLRSVHSPETAEDVPDFVVTVDLTYDEFTETFLDEYPGAIFEDDPNDWFADIEYTESGRIYGVTIGGIPIRGTQFRRLFDLRSTFITFEIYGEHISLTTTGFGHGVGMSQYGANVMAQQGIAFRDILRAYYFGIIVRTFE